ncbi:MAG: carbohydrate kinase [Rhodobacteraceae bacterium]|nr:carbohydrate kinase [Paracoccaceae bacterium]
MTQTTNALRNIAVIDIGKSNVKLALADLQTLTEIEVLSQPNNVLPGPPWPHFDTEAHWQFILDGLRQLHKQHGIDALAVTTHGACAALLGADGKLTAPILDYEHTGLDALADEYTALRPDFVQTGSPRLAMGLNLGAQLHWQFAKQPELRNASKAIVTYPQYWVHRLTGQLGCDVTTLGCHTDLWNPYKQQYSALVDRLGLRGQMAPPLQAGAKMAELLPHIAAATGLPPGTPVATGIHDSNASLLPHLLEQEPPFCVVSTGTWVVVMSVGGQEQPLDPARDTLMLVNALGARVPAARFMGGREYELLMGAAQIAPNAADIAAVLRDEIMLHPAVEPTTGPFQGRTAQWSGAEPCGAIRAAAASFYLALVSAECLALTGAQGPVIVEGAFAKNRAYLEMLASACNRGVIAATTATGTSIGAALLFAPKRGGTNNKPEAAILPNAQMQTYAAKWRALL